MHNNEQNPRIPELKLFDEILADKGENAVSQKTGHKIIKTKKHIFKYNKNNKPFASLMEFVVHQLIYQQLPQHVPEIALVVNNVSNDSERRDVVGVAVTRIDDFYDMTQYNLIRLLAELEGHAVKYQDEGEFAGQLRAYFSDEEKGKERRQHCFKEYMTLLFIRHLMQEDDGHKGNYGFSFKDGEVKLYGIDYDMALYALLSANFDMVRRTQWGSPFHRFRLTLEDIYNFPFVKNTQPGHYPGIIANSWQAKSLTPNPGRYTESDVKALEFLCEQEDFCKKKREAILEVMDSFLKFNVKEFEKTLNDYTPDKLKGTPRITNAGKINFPHVVACAVAKIQTTLYAKLGDIPTDPQDEFYGKMKEVRETHNKKYASYLGMTEHEGEKVSLQHNAFFQKFINRLETERETQKAKIFLELIVAMEGEHYLHYRDNLMKRVAIEAAKLCAVDCELQELKALVDVWKDKLDGTFVVKSRNSTLLARKLKEPFYNHMTTTYVTIKDIFLQRALALRRSGEDASPLIAVLMQSNSLIQSHSDSPLTFLQRIQLHGSYTVLGNYHGLTLTSYLHAKHGVEKLLLYSVIFSPVVVIKDAFFFSLQFSLFLTELVVRMPRRFAADLFRWVARQDVAGKLPLNSVGLLIWLVATTLQYAAKITQWLLHKMTCPLISAREDSAWMERRLRGENKILITVLGNITYTLSLLASCALYFAVIKTISYVLPLLGAGYVVALTAKFLVHLCPALGLYTLGLAASVGIFVQKASEDFSRSLAKHNLWQSRVLRAGYYPIAKVSDDLNTHLLSSPAL